jgi:hypothetical protein
MILRPEHGRLFSASGSILDLLERRRREIPEEVDRIPKQDLQTMPEAELTRRLESRLRLDPPRLHLDQVYTPGDPQEVKVGVSHEGFTRAISGPGPVYVSGVRVEMRIPFSGSGDLLYFAPTRGEMTYVEGSVNDQEIVLALSVPTDSINADSVKTELENRRARIDRHTQWLAADCEGYNAELTRVLDAAIRRRKDQLGKHSELARVLDIPVKRREDRSPVFEVPVKPRPVPVQAPSAAMGQSHPPEPGISDQAYGAIVQQLITTRGLVERLPKTFGGLGEEALRDILLVVLNNQFGPAGGETFSGLGKTDILIYGREQPVFIAECKIWSGAAAFAKAIDQLLGYLVWRDTRGALVLFVKQADVTAAEAKAVGAIKDHGQYVEDAAPVASCQSFVLHHAGDLNRTIRVTLVAVPISKAARPGIRP